MIVSIALPLCSDNACGSSSLGHCWLCFADTGFWFQTFCAIAGLLCESNCQMLIYAQGLLWFPSYTSTSGCTLISSLISLPCLCQLPNVMIFLLLATPCMQLHFSSSHHAASPIYTSPLLSCSSINNSFKKSSGLDTSKLESAATSNINLTNVARYYLTVLLTSEFFYMFVLFLSCSY